jgi:VWFA-related protein
MVKRSVAVLCLCGLGSLSASQTPEKPQEPQTRGYQFGVEVMLVPVPVFVTDSQGRPVEGLTAEDFSLSEEGKPRPIVYFEPVSHERLAAAAPRDRARPLPPGLRRHFLLFFDLTFSSSSGLLRAREAAIQFLSNEVLATDLVGVATFSTLGGLKILSNFTSDRERVIQVVNTLGLVKTADVIQDPVGFVFDPSLQRPEGPGNVPSGIDSNNLAQLADHLRALSDRMKQSDQNAYRNQATEFLGQFMDLSSALGSLSGRKYILLLSEGIDSKYITGAGITQFDEDFEKLATGRVEQINTDTRFGRPELRDMLMKGLSDAAAADVVIHALDTSGLGGEAGGPTGRGEGGGQDTLFLMANETGGKLYKNVNDLREPLANIVKETSSYYLLGFNPADLERKGRFRKIKVDVKRSGVKVTARRGYFEPKTADKMTEAERKLQVAEYVTKDLLSDDVHFEVLTAVFPGQGSLARLPVLMKFPGEQFVKGQRRSGLLQLDIYGYIVEPGGQFVDFFSKSLAFDLKKEGERFEETGLLYYDLLLSRPGPMRMKLIVSDRETGLFGSQIEDIEVPDFTKKELLITPPLFVAAQPGWITIRGFDPAQPEPRRQGMPVSYPFHTEGTDYIPAVRPTLKKSEPSNFVVRVYNLKTQGGQPQTEMKFERVDAEGNRLTLRQVGLMRRPEQPEPNCYELALQARWDDVPTGSALIQMSLTDQLAKKTAVSSSPFVLAR